MKRKLFLWLILIVLVVGVVWVLRQPDDTTVVGQSHPAQAAMKTIIAPKSASAVAPPKLEAVPASDKNSGLQFAPTDDFSGSTPAIMHKMNNPPPPVVPNPAMDAKNLTDLGDVNFIAGVPKLIKLSDDTNIIVTATQAVDGKLNLQFEFTFVSVNGTAKTTSLTFESVEGRDASVTLMSSPVQDIKLIPHMN